MECLICGGKTESEDGLCSEKCRKKFCIKMAHDQIDKLPNYPNYKEKTLNLDWGRFAIAADWHNPFVSKKVFKDLIKECQDRRINKIVIAGDFFDMNNFTKFFSLNSITWAEEKAFARGCLEILKGTFKEIAFIVANHELRWLKALKCGDGDIHDIYELIGFKRRQRITVQHRCFVRDWVILHPDTYRKTPLSYARDRAAMYPGKHIVVTHAHMQAMGRDPSGDRFLVDLGMMGDPNLIEYKNINETAHYAWNRGFMIVEKGNRPILFNYSQ